MKKWPALVAPAGKEPTVSNKANSVPAVGTQGRVATLSDLAEQIRTEHQAVVVAAARGLDHALAAGTLLIKVRDSNKLKHGKWEFWVKQNCEIAIETVRLYIRLAEHRETVEANRQRVTGLSIRAAAKLIAGPSNKKAQSVAALPAVAKPTLNKAGTGGELWSVWDRTPPAERLAFFECVGLQEILDHLPEAWARSVEQRLSDWQPWTGMPADCHDGDDLEIPTFLKRERVH